MKKVLLVIMMVLVGSLVAESGEIEKVIVDVCKNRAEAIEKARCLFTIYDKSGNKMAEVQEIWVKRKIRWENNGSQGTFLKVYDGKYEYAQGVGLPTLDVYRSDFDYLYKKYGKLAKFILPLDIRDIFTRIKQDSLKYVGIKNVSDESSWAEYVYVFEGTYLRLNVDNRKLGSYNCKLEIDSKTGLLYRLEIKGSERCLIIEKVEFDSGINEGIFKVEEKNFVDSTLFWDRLLKEITEEGGL